MKDMIVTGGYGFIGSNFIHLHNKMNRPVLNIDNLTYAANLDNLANLPHPALYRHKAIAIQDSANLAEIMMREQPEVIVNFAAETHVDRSINQAEPFFSTNVMGTLNIAQTIMDHSPHTHLVHISTDEVYGSLTDKDPQSTEKDRFNPSSPYSASKASAEHIVNAFVKTHGLRATILRLTNCFGPRQHGEKFIPTVIRNALQDRPIPLYGDGQNRRSWLYVEDACRAISTIVAIKPRGVYNIGSKNELANIYVAKTILRAMGKSDDLIEFVEDRKGHDYRYSISSRKMKFSLGEYELVSFATGIQDTIDYYREHT
jgi:dTDP-glucose 4,6-dehydratase